MTWVFEELVSWIFGLIGALFDMISKSFLEAFTIDTEGFSKYIPIFDQAEDIIIIIAIALSTLILMVSLIGNMVPLTTDQLESAPKIVGRYLIAIFIAFNGKAIIDILFDLFSQFYVMLLGIENYTWSLEGVGTKLSERFQPQSAGEVMGDGVSGAASLVFGIFFLIAILINYLRLLLEGAERYVVINLSMIFAPLSGCLLVSKNTQRAFGAYFRMAASQLLLMCMNVLFIRGATGMMISYSSTPSEGEELGGSLLWMILLLAFMKAGQAIDAYMRSLGLDVSQTGGTLVTELLSSGQTLSRAAYMGSRMIGGASGRGGFGGKAGREASQAYDNGVISPNLSNAERQRKSGVNAAENIQAAMNKSGANGNVKPGALDPFMMKEAMAMGTMPDIAKNGTLAAAAVASMAPQLASIPGFDGAKVSMGKGNALVNFGDGRSAKLFSEPPTNGKPYMPLTTMDANGNPVTTYLQNTGDKPLLGQDLQRGEEANFMDAYGTQAVPMAEYMASQIQPEDAISANAMFENPGQLQDATMTPVIDPETGDPITNHNGEPAMAFTSISGQDMEALRNTPISSEDILNSHVEGIGNGCTRVVAPDGTSLGTMIASNADTDQRTGVGIPLNGESLQGNTVDSYRFVPANHMDNIPSAEDGFAGEVLQSSDGSFYDCSRLAEDYSGASSDREVVSMDAAADGAVSLGYRDGSAQTISKDDLSGYQTDILADDVISPHCGMSRIMTPDQREDMLNQVVGGQRDESSDIINYARNNDESYTDFTLRDASKIRVYDADVYSVSGSGSSVVQIGNTQGYAAEVTVDKQGKEHLRAAKVNRRGTPDGRK